MNKPQIGDIWQYPDELCVLIVEEQLDDEYGMEYAILQLWDGKYAILDRKGFQTYGMTKAA